ncbi:dihydrofolate reductase family protein [Ekhidna sp.]|uniref:dihydrofolate reductase family protein n=1 Tax=Ekhidna sp. TaxID=2608089 RepID=UPI003B5C52BA
MRKIVLNLAVTLDGFIEGPNGEIDWLDTGEKSSNGSSQLFQFLEEIDTIFYGRISYEKWGEFQPASDAESADRRLWETVHSKKKYVFSNTLSPLSANAEVIGGNLETRVKEIQEEPGRNIWLYGGSGLITTFMNLGLVDELLLAVFPVVLGQGKPLFAGIERRTDLRLNNVITESGITLLSYDCK